MANIAKTITAGTKTARITTISKIRIASVPGFSMPDVRGWFNDVNSGPSDPGCRRTWFNADYLFAWVKPGPLGVPLVTVGNPADLVVLDCRDRTAAIAELATPLFGIKNGRRSFERSAPRLHRPVESSRVPGE